ncbi:MAG: VWA domain-containing protein [Terrimicrobiaceae bacterium]
MSFLFPIAWWLGGLALPVIAFYLLKTRQRRRDVSSLLFWEALKPKVENSPFWRKLRRWLSLLLLLLILALLVAAIARPAFDWEQKAPRRVVAVVDPSASMQASVPAPGRWLDSQDRLQAAISRMRVQDEMAILTAENPPRILSGWTSSQRVLRGAVEGLAPLPHGTDPSPALELAGDLTSLREDPVIEIYSDSVWPVGSWDQPLANSRIEGLVLPDARNVGLSLFAVRRSPVAPGDWQLDAEVVSTWPYSGTLEIHRNGEPMDLIPVTSEPGQPWRKTWRGSVQEGATFEARLKLETIDALALDDFARCELAPLETLDLLVIGAPDPYLEAVLSSIPLVNFWIENKMPSALPPGTDMILAIGAPHEIPGVPILIINPDRSGFWGEKTGMLEGVPLHAKGPALLARHADLNSVVVEKASRWEPAPGAEVIASAMDAPLIFGRWDREPKWLVIGFDPTESDFPLRTAFPIFLGNVFQALRDTDDLKLAAGVLPGPIESAMVPLAKLEEAAPSAGPSGLALPGWWIVALVGLGLLVAEWYLYNRRITD